MKGTLTEKNVWEVVNYVRSIGPGAGATGTAKPSTTPAPAKATAK